MIRHPTALELIDAVARFIEERAAPALKDRDAFHARVAVNALGVVRRELEAGAAAEAAARERLRGLLGRDGDFETLNAALCDGLRAGEIALDHPGLMDHLKRSAAEQVGIDQPGYSGLKALLGEPGGG
ncbi:MAG: protein kinase [Caulobacteraceae bacterium]|nr:protein kinase [Caulobacteraceae bacterium]